MKIVVLAIASVVLFLVAAKVHGRALRLEREAMGFMTVTFGGTNPPEVEALWKADRMRFWPLAGVLAVAFGALTFVLSRDVGLTVMAVLSWAPSLSFLVCAVLSTARR